MRGGYVAEVTTKSVIDKGREACGIRRDTPCLQRCMFIPVLSLLFIADMTVSYLQIGAASFS